MSGLMDKAQDAVGNKMDKDAQPGDGVEKTADNDANQQINNAADDAGVPKEADKAIDDVADSKVNNDIPMGN
ncbi:hypothetical protein LTR36_001542 [Oleoguttula mirabilis]|uniref:MT0933-like antitoxin protein n=1 Tax=Oleoguttula mirabilis TaxID=1507867 RepID=A0AAV9JMM9_9PEZI|nr:hypothetical protein LTR36_001542 [Oleoguttula mirabilis]